MQKQNEERRAFEHEHSELIAKQNDDFRKHVLRAPHPNGLCRLTIGFNALDDFTQFRIREIIRATSIFDPENDLYGEHDFGSVSLVGIPKVFWKIEYFENREMAFGTPTPQAEGTFRVLTLMLAEEY